ncbi:MAG TPA: lasso peptide biosynthesis B2 protein [Anaerolineales bacterium]|nr:lasso peptide biosynthesis B2 protein [Anaerolineales bacterium]
MLKQLTDKAIRLTLLDWLALLEAWWLLLFFRLGLLWMSYERLIISTHAKSETNPDLANALIIAQKVQRLVGLASRLHPIHMTCLVKSLTLKKMLSKRNIHAHIKIGAQKIGNTMYAHAWVEAEGKPIGEADDVAQKFSVFESVAKINIRHFI